MIYICSNCVKEQKLLPQVAKAQVEGIPININGRCIRHYVESLAERGKTKAQIEVTVRQILASSKFRPPPDLKKRPDLVKQYKQGIFS
jgi:hypothetical protein